MTSRAKFWLGFAFLVTASVTALVLSGMTWTDIKHIGTPRNALLIEGVNVKIPFPEESDGRVLPEVPITTTGDYSFMFGTQDDPVRWDPCRPIAYVINPDGSPTGGDDLIFEAVSRVSEASGLAFQFEGYTSEVASFERPLVQEDRYGDRFAPLIFGWSDEATDADLVDSVTGLGGSSSVPGAFGSQRFLVGGVVLLDGPDVEKILVSQGGAPLAVAVIMHETGHVVGLGHVDDSTELMNPSNSALLDWGPGDREGLSIAGSGPCQNL